MLMTTRKPATVGEILTEEVMEPLGLTQGALAEAMGVQRKHVNELCGDRRNVTAATALILARVFGNGAEFWLDVQRRNDLWQIMNTPEERAGSSAPSRWRRLRDREGRMGAGSVQRPGFAVARKFLPSFPPRSGPMTSKLLLAFVIVVAGAQAAAGQDRGASVGTSVVPSTHTPGCGGLLCDGNDPDRQAGAPPPKPCKAIICGDTPVTASEAQRRQDERARAAEAAPAAVEKDSPKPRHRKVVRAKKAPAVATRTPAAGPQ